jgi:hypothetical protein
MNETFTKENFDNLKRICLQISSLCDENVDGQLMAIQLILLGNKIEDFSNNPIVKTSGKW